MIVRGYTNTMIPADVGAGLAELIRIALINISYFDKICMHGETVEIGNTTVELSHLKTYRTEFEEGLAQIACRQGWTMEQCGQVRALKKKCPPDRLYRIRGGYHSITSGMSPIGLVVSYRPGANGAPAEAGIAILGFANDMLGSATQPFGVPLEGLEDITEDARSGRLLELHRG